MGDLGPGSGAGQGHRAGGGVVRGVSGQGVGGPTFCVGVECGVCVERCPFGVEIIAKMREAEVLFEATTT
jgi:ferredoxin